MRPGAPVAADGKNLAGFLAAHVGALDDDFGDDIAATRDLLELDDPWND